MTKRIILNDQGGAVINWEYSDTCPTLRSQTKGHEPIIMEEQKPIAFRKSRRAQSKDDCETWVDDGISNTLNSFDTGERDTHAIVYENHGQDSRIKEVKIVPQINAKAGTGGGNLPLVQGCNPFNGTVTGTVTANSHGTTAKGPKVFSDTVRRLTPKECERLQGFPDGYTSIPWKMKPASECPDGPRYKAIGNSWAVPCARWIGERIEAVDKKIKERNNGTNTEH